MEQYLIDNNIEHVINENYCELPNFKCFTVPTETFDNKYLFGRSDRFNLLLEKFRQNNYKYYINLYIPRNSVHCIFTMNGHWLVIKMSTDFNFDFINDCCKYINDNLKYSSISTCGHFTVCEYHIAKNCIAIYPNSIYIIGDTNISIKTFDEFVKYAEENLSEYFINDDIKIALK